MYTLPCQARIKAAGGRIVFNSGSHRVMGMLAMSRAIGDHFLRPYVIAEPEVGRKGLRNLPHGIWQLTC
jgi:protein phosphatase 2C